MKRHHKSADGLYHIKGKTYKVLVGSRAQVGNETAFKTSGGLEKKDLIYINGRWKSEKKHKNSIFNNFYIRRFIYSPPRILFCFIFSKPIRRFEILLFTNFRSMPKFISYI